ncbi:unnamed protein product [Miscanthus lutarioriparius]|uniref:Uncharacterized protein n=1 Tax=Miscanthus lutarioriparius TaxID=422564 RepID=A0A811SLP4_9POAL|nr:unnamed protein product [Miscanthus lutarioriparius]
MAASFSSTVCRILVVVAVIVATLSSYGAAKNVCILPCDKMVPDCDSWCRDPGFFGNGGNCYGGTCCCHPAE